MTYYSTQLKFRCVCPTVTQVRWSNETVGKGKNAKTVQKANITVLVDFDKESLPDSVANEGYNIEDVKVYEITDKFDEYASERDSLVASTSIFQKRKPNDSLSLAGETLYNPSWLKLDATEMKSKRNEGIKKALEKPVSEGGYGLPPQKQKKQ